MVSSGFPERLSIVFLGATLYGYPMGSSLKEGPFWGPIYLYGCRTVLGTQKGTLIRELPRPPPPPVVSIPQMALE